VTSTFVGIADGPVIALAHLVLKRAKITSIPVTSREHAIRVLRGVKPAPPRKSKQNVKPVYSLCCVCYQPMATGTLCDSLGRRHASCEVKP
jgi:hypothetical protein